MGLFNTFQDALLMHDDDALAHGSIYRLQFATFQSTRFQKETLIGPYSTISIKCEASKRENYTYKLICEDDAQTILRSKDRN